MPWLRLPIPTPILTTLSLSQRRLSTTIAIWARGLPRTLNTSRRSSNTRPHKFARQAMPSARNSLHILLDSIMAIGTLPCERGSINNLRRTQSEHWARFPWMRLMGTLTLLYNAIPFMRSPPRLESEPRNYRRSFNASPEAGTRRPNSLTISVSLQRMWGYSSKLTTQHAV